MAIDAVEELDGLADVVHMRGHLHEGKAGRAKQLLRGLHCAELRAREKSESRDLVGQTRATGKGVHPSHFKGRCAVHGARTQLTMSLLIEQGLF